MTAATDRHLRFQATINAQSHRLVTQGGTEFLVAPVTAVISGVLNGQLLPEEELRRSVRDWEEIPITVDHWIADDDIAAHTIGHLKNVRLARGSTLAGDAWFPLPPTPQAAAIIEAIKNGVTVEVSTGYWAFIDDTSGVRNGKEYHGVQRDIEPTHLAVLPNDIGACSVADGCGVPVFNSRFRRHADMKENHIEAIADNLRAVRNLNIEGDLAERTNLIVSATVENFGPSSPEDETDFPRIQAITDEFVVFDQENRTFQVNYEIATVDGRESVAFGDKREVRVVFEPVGNSQEKQQPNGEPQAGLVERFASAVKQMLAPILNKGENAMERTEALKLIQNALKLSDEQMNQFDGLDDATVGVLAKQHCTQATAKNEPKAEPTEPAPAPVANAKPEQSEPPQPVEPPKLTWDQLKQIMPPEYLAAMESVNNQRETEANGLRERLKKEGWQDAELEGMGVAAMRRIANQLGPRNYMGAGPAAASLGLSDEQEQNILNQAYPGDLEPFPVQKPEGRVQ